MITFIIGLMILFFGALIYGNFVERIIRPDDRKTPAVEINDGVDFVPMKKWKNCLINLLNISGTGPILGPIQGILFGPIAFITIPIGCVISGATHDFLCGMASMRNKGLQMPKLIEKFLGKRLYVAYVVLAIVLMLLVVAVFTYTPGDIFVNNVLGMGDSFTVTVIVYGLILAYYILASALPIDKIIGRVYPIFGLILIISTIAIFVALFGEQYSYMELDLSNGMSGIFDLYPVWDVTGNAGAGTAFIPVFFVTVACGITSGFHATQNTIIARSVTNEREGKHTFYWMMIAEGFIAMVWAAAAMALYNTGTTSGSTSAIAEISKMMLGPIGGAFALFGVIVLPITSGDTALRSCRLMIAEHLHIDQSNAAGRLKISIAIIIIPIILLILTKSSPSGFGTIWNYFAWLNQILAVFGFAMLVIYLMSKKNSPKLAFLIALIPGSFYAFIVSSFILSAKIGLNLPYGVSYIVAAIVVVAYIALLMKFGRTYSASHTEE